MGKIDNFNKYMTALKGALFLIAIIAICVGSYFAYVTVVSVFKKTGEVAEDTGNFLSGKPTVNGAELGESCNVGADCKGFVSAFNQAGGVACCSGKCEQTLKDWANVWYCKNECKGGPMDAPGTCGLLHWPRHIGEKCDAHTDCEGWGPEKDAVACCQNKCEKKKVDWAGVGYCPHECKGGPFMGPGSC